MITHHRSTACRLAAFALATTALTATAARAASPCTALSGTFPNGATLSLSEALGYNGTSGPIVDVVTGTDVAAGVLSAAPASPAVCEVSMVISSDGNPSDSQIQVAVLLPVDTVGTNQHTIWNGRFLGTGNGGFAGAIADGTLVLGLLPYYATYGSTFVVANTDLGDGAGLGGSGSQARKSTGRTGSRRAPCATARCPSSARNRSS